MKTEPYDAAKYLDSLEVIEAYFAEAKKVDDVRVLQIALEDIKRAAEMHGIAVGHLLDN